MERHGFGGNLKFSFLKNGIGKGKEGSVLPWAKGRPIKFSPS
jgi:hypothetical protein